METGAYNRQPVNPNELYNNKFTVRIYKLPETVFKCRSVTLPGETIPTTQLTTIFNPIPIAGLNVTFEPLEMEIIVDEDMRNFIEVTDWLRGLAMPTDRNQYSNVKNEPFPGPEGGLVSDILVQILSNESIPNINVFFRDAFPISKSGLKFTNNTNNPEEQVMTVRFEYSDYQIERVYQG